ncbi:Condensin complex subunit 1 [Fulvia fulva]|uniref:Condensin complex subunit 1 n=1 Tax=Passalora fulva TaxID=5499 RepID=A0A9Q8PFK2_PASFU|nr:Condensin complex subunit 1 [Fulvia fulva]KAK4613714.1 Condensin complex subunit 1 [Fulvia fulva]KAK4614645.1 Condensin complex subunit 1 [Fulvia fulva]UJO21568.1 Condensin complex subunit 1 [Fulvia fulva]WPV20521.1 Condensin complex subunit 1 [Fulvia fulva]WPV35147.1 Condensin complex subunit 1 [Fulvia fulva]
MSDFDIGDALTAYLDDPHAIPTPEADAALVDCENDPDAFTPGVINSVLNGVADAVGENPEAILQASNLDSLQFLLKQTSFIPSQSLGKVFDLVISGLAAEAEIVHHEEQDGETETAQHKQILEIFAYLLQWCVAAVEAKSAEKTPAPARGKGAKGPKSKAGQKDGNWDPTAQLQTALDTMAKVMKLKLSKIFVTTSELDTFIGLFTRPTYLILESETRVKSTAIRMHAFKVLCVAIKHHGHAYGAQTNIIQNLTYFEHLSEPMAEFLNILYEQYDYPQLAEEVMKELSNKEFSANDTKGPKSVSTFVARLSELAPRLVQRQVTYLAKLLESENYTLRCAIIEVCGNLIAMLSKVEEGERREEHKGQINAFFDVLEERFLDINPYCRCRAIQVYGKLCDLETKYPKRRQKAAELAAQSLEDKSSNVRRNAIKLLAKLIGTHPFAILHGGKLSWAEWNERLEAVENELASLKPPAGTPGLGEIDEREKTVDESMLEEPTQMPGSPEKAPRSEEEMAAAMQKAQEQAATAEALNKLSLTRRYYVEALRFIETLHEASPHVTQLLSSKNKSEIIEAMDFFVTADAYYVETAKTGIRRMLRLIWTKGNSDEGKGVQTHLIDCYRGLFFTAPTDYSPPNAAQYVARNMMSLTYGATPAELTSLEQLLATMMREKAINDLVIGKLWSVYGVQKQQISKSQRRGAIIVLGMLALADPEIVVREMGACLRIGLGEHGRRDLVLARFTCIALMRMTNSKSVKGTEAPPSTRLPNDHAVLIKLASLLEIESDSRDWYGLAEQAVGAIYALSRHPDVLCSEVLRRKTKTVFARRPAPSTTSEEPEHSQVDEQGDVEMSDMPEEASAAEVLRPTTAKSDASDGMGSALALSQLLFVVGHVALKQIVHLELCEQDFKRRKVDKEKSNPPTSAKKAAGSRAASGAQKKEEEQSEMDLIGGTTEDDFTDAIAHVRERELLYGQQSLLTHFGPLVKEICSNNTSYPNAELQAQAALCMAKLMCVSSEYCEANLSLLITILERSPSSITRSNLVVALGDMAVCFNHLIDENTDFLYRRLSDSSLQVKRTCLMTLTFLILAGQVKVKGQLGEMAKCIEDNDDRIREMSRIFFAELAGKDNAIYNHFVDMFSLLSADEGLEEDQFRKVIKFLASFIEKDKHAKQLASKLAPRLQRAENERQWNDVAFALGLLPHKNEDIAKLVGEGCKVVETNA